MNSIKQIGFANTVIATNTKDPLIELKWTIAVVFKLG